jgi:hypothetical protein
MTDAGRLHNIARHWSRYPWDGNGKSRWEQWEWKHYIFFSLFPLLFSIMVIAKALSENGEKQPLPFFGWLAESPAGVAALALLVLLNGWLIDRSLADRTPFESTLPLWVRCTRRLAVTLPLLGLYAISCWRWVVRSRPGWAFRPSVSPLVFSSPSSPRTAMRHRVPSLGSRLDSLRRAQSQSLVSPILWLIAAQIAPWLAWLSWMTTATSLSPQRRATLGMLSLLFRVLACAIAVQYGIVRGRQIRARRERLLVLWLAPFLFLPPFPSWFLALLVWFPAMGERGSLVSQVWESKSQPSSQTIHARWPSPPTAFSSDRENSDVMDACAAFQRLKTFLLFLDAGALAWILTRSGRPLFSFSSFSLRQLAPYLFLAALGLAAEVALLLRRIFGWFRRQTLAPLPYGRSVMATQLTFAGGLLFGSLLAIDQAATAGHLLTVIGLGAVLIFALILSAMNYFLTRTGAHIFVILAWVLLFFEILVVGSVMYYQPELTPPFVALFHGALVLTPLWSVALFFGLGGWLLHPFRLRHIFDRRLPGSLRGALAVVALTSALPLGGLVIPFWIYTHHRLWPRYEPLLWSLEKEVTL